MNTSLQFSQMGLIDDLLRALADDGYTNPTPIQAQSLPVTLKGHDVLACAQTGTGKTAAFALPILQQLHNSAEKSHDIKVLVLVPTRELAQQVYESFVSYGKYLKLKSTVVYGGVSLKPQIMHLKQKPEILIATPGRLLDLMNQGFINLSKVSYLVLDEADRMLDMGFLPDVKRIIKDIPKSRQSFLFSATMPKEILGLAHSLLNNPHNIQVAPVSSTNATIEQKVYFVSKGNKRELLKSVFNDKSITKVVVFTRTKHTANKVSETLNLVGVKSAAYHSNKSQNARLKALDDFKKGNIRALVASDIAARGIDVDNVTHVINYELPNIPETYVHRIGRTGRAGANGIAISFCDAEELAYLRDIEKLTKNKVEIVTGHMFEEKYVLNKQPQQQQNHSNEQKRPHRPAGKYNTAGSQNRGQRNNSSGGNNQNKQGGPKSSTSNQNNSSPRNSNTNQNSGAPKNKTWHKPNPNRQSRPKQG